MKAILKANFGFDIDGVLTDDDDGHKNIWLLYGEKFFGKPIVKPSFFIEEAFDITPKEAETFFKEMQETVYNAVSVRPYCAEVLNNLRNLGVNIHLITARDERHRDLTEDWLKKAQVPYDSLQMSPFNQSYCKGDKCLELGIEFFVEDNLQNAKSVAQRDIYTLLFHASHNRSKLTTLPRVKDWREISSHIRFYLRNRPLRDFGR